MTALHETCTTDQAAPPSFDHDWQRRAFGLALALSEFGHYPWSEFQQSLIDTIGGWEAPPRNRRVVSGSTTTTGSQHSSTSSISERSSPHR